MGTSGKPCAYCDSGLPSVMGRRCILCRRAHYRGRYAASERRATWVPRTEVAAIIQRTDRDRLDLIADYAERWGVPIKTVVARYGSMCYNKHHMVHIDEADRWSILIRLCPWENAA